MLQKKEICLLNDSFPPLIDGVSNAVSNYARIITESEKYSACVITPENSAADDSAFPYQVIRYPGIDLTGSIGYTAGNPFSKKLMSGISGHDIRLLHSHCPAMSNIVAREIRGSLDVPIILTYHTKFDLDIDNITDIDIVKDGLIRALVESVSSCDELWAVSDGAGKNIRSLGYEGDYIVMPNGVDIERQTPDPDEVRKLTADADIPEGLPVFLFVGRMMWYKGIRIILDALAALKSRDLDFRMVFIGGGTDYNEIRNAASQMMLTDRCIFLGPVHDRCLLTAWYGRADLFLFPSTFDTNGLVVREAAACSLGSVLIKGSCAAEGITDNSDGLLIEENAASLAVCLATVMQNRDFMKSVGKKASETLYLSWDDAVKNAMERYEIVLDNWRSGKYPRHKNPADMAFRIFGEAIEVIQKAGYRLKEFESLIHGDF